MGYTQLLKDGALGETNSQQTAAVNTIAARSKDLSNMINSLLCATSIEGKAARLEACEVSMKDFLLELKNDFQPSSGKEIVLNWDHSSELPNIETDGPKLKQILQNIINNAIKFTERGTVNISVRHCSDAKTVEFIVADTGIGISAAEMPYIFERFHQVDSSQNRPFEGVGLGLYIAKEFTEMLGGKVAVESEPERGSTFTIAIPSEVASSNE
jgi:signal transduction histidine kinase